MSSLKVEATEPDPAATSIPNDVTVNKENGDTSAPTAMDIVADDVKVEVKEEENGAAEDVKAEVKKEENGAPADTKDVKSVETEMEDGEEKKQNERTYEEKGPLNGVLKTSAQVREGKNNSRYDASILPESEDPSKIRAQVWPCEILTIATTNFPRLNSTSQTRICQPTSIFGT